MAGGGLPERARHPPLCHPERSATTSKDFAGKDQRAIFACSQRGNLPRLVIGCPPLCLHASSSRTGTIERVLCRARSFDVVALRSGGQNGGWHALAGHPPPATGHPPPATGHLPPATRNRQPPQYAACGPLRFFLPIQGIVLRRRTPTFSMGCFSPSLSSRV